LIEGYHRDTQTNTQPTDDITRPLKLLVAKRSRPSVDSNRVEVYLHKMRCVVFAAMNYKTPHRKATNPVLTNLYSCLATGWRKTRPLVTVGQRKRATAARGDRWAMQLRSIVMSMSLCVCVCLSVCSRGYLRNDTRDIYQFLCMWPCLGLLRQGDEIPMKGQSWSFLPHWQCIVAVWISLR